MDSSKIKNISKEELFELMENKEKFTLVEVLAEEDYASGHLPFAINIPVDKIADAASRLLPDTNELIVVYCSGFSCTASTGATRALQSMGYTNCATIRVARGIGALPDCRW
jgi:rhodanese-related sulfurtransferase